MKDWPYDTFPTGWYQIGYSSELAPGDVRPVRYFDQDLVLFRTEDGEAALLDAYCQHLGAHLGYGGKVKGDCIECPFHGWQWSTDGTLAEIPYAPGETRRVRLGQRPIREICGLIVTWYDAFGREPFWEWPGIREFADEEHNYPITHDHVGIRKIIPQSPVENTPDYYHFMWVHGSGQPGRPMLWRENGHYLHTRTRFVFGHGKKSTWMTPNGAVTGEIQSEAWGLGLSNARFVLEDFITNQLTATTPVDREHSQMFTTLTCSREAASHPDPANLAARMIEFQKGQIRNDFAIWENQRYIEHPPFAGGEEEHYARFRRWSRQFYTDQPYSADIELVTEQLASLARPAAGGEGPGRRGGSAATADRFGRLSAGYVAPSPLRSSSNPGVAGVSRRPVGNLPDMPQPAVSPDGADWAAGNNGN